MAKRDHRYLIDERLYTVVGINGFRQGNLTREQAGRLAAKIREEMERAGWAGDVKIYYRDGSVAK